MYTAAQLRLIARHYRRRAVDAERPSMQGMLMVMADEFERDALIADREERLAAFRRQAAERMSEAPNVVAVEIAA